MRVVGVSEFGSPDVLREFQVPERHAGPGEVRIRVRAAAVNPTDTALRAGLYAERLRGYEPPYVPGMDVAGEIDEVGDDVPDEFRVGDRVMAIVVPEGAHGGYSESIVLPYRSVAPVPAGADFPAAASLPMNGLTARLALDLLALQPGQVLGVTGAAGAFGGYVVQLAKADGLRVIADAADKDRELVRSLGADVVVQRGDDVKQALREILIEKLNVGDTALDLTTQPSVVLVIGVNGVGKTTTIGKLALRLKNQGRKVILGAADTFRAAAIEQLEVWAKRADVELIKHAEGADPASVVFDTIAAGKARSADVIIIDTAGRLHNKKNLMDELNKISRVIERELPGASKEVLLVLDATTGQNAVNQAKDFKDAAGITGIVLTKLDGTARGGVVLAINNELDVPVKFVGVGEQIDDLQPFDADAFAAGLFDKAPTEVDEDEIASFIGSAEAAADEKAEKGSQN